MRLLPKPFFARDTLAVARELVGKILEVNEARVRITEIEAYCRDEASHAFTNTSRSKIMFETYGHIYIYLIYGMYYCLNFTTNKDDAGAVLIRAAEPLSGIEEMKARRRTDQINQLCSGPGKLCQALGINRDLNSLPVGKEIKLFDDGFKPRISRSARIGITKAVDLPWRFFITDSTFLSR